MVMVTVSSSTASYLYLTSIPSISSTRTLSLKVIDIVYKFYHCFYIEGMEKDANEWIGEDC